MGWLHAGGLAGTHSFLPFGGGPFDVWSSILQVMKLQCIWGHLNKLTGGIFYSPLVLKNQQYCVIHCVDNMYEL